ncbi:hypothetical protein Tco_0018495 [Tanacetum coccineum]
MDSMIPNGQKNILAEYMILSGTDNRPPMLDKPLYDSWKSKMELYMQNIEHGRMMLESVEHGPLDWPSIKVDGVTRLKKYVELSTSEKLQADCDLNATNIILQGLPTDVYALVNHHRIANDLWEQACPQPQSVPQIEYTVSIVNQQTHIDEFPRIDSGLAVHVFKQGDGPIDAINKMMLFLSTVVTSCFPTTNNQLRNSSNSRQQATIHDGRVSVQPVQGRQSLFDAGIIQCPKPKRKRDATWYRDKVLLVEAQGYAYQADDLDAYDSDCDDLYTAKAVLMANFSSYRSNVLSKMKAGVQQYFVDKQCFKIQKKQFLIENDRLLDQIISQDIMNIVVNSSLDINTSVNMNSSAAMNDSVNYMEMCNKCFELEAEHIKQHNMVEKYEYNRLSKSFSKLEQHCISLELAMQLNKEIFQKNNTSVNQTEPSFDQLFELNNLKAKLQQKTQQSRRVSWSTKSSKSKSTDNTKNDRILLISSRTQKKNKVEDHSRIVNSMFDARHELYFLEFVSDMNAISKSKTFTLVGNAYPLTRIITTNKVPLREPIPLEVVAQEFVVTKVYTRRRKVPKTNGSNSKPKIAKSVIYNKTEPGTSRGSNTSVVPSSSSSIDLSTVKFGNDQIAKIMRYGDYQIGNITISRVYYVEGLGHNLFSVG